MAKKKRSAAERSREVSGADLPWLKPGSCSMCGGLHLIGETGMCESCETEVWSRDEGRRDALIEQLDAWVEQAQGVFTDTGIKCLMERKLEDKPIVGIGYGGLWRKGMTFRTVWRTVTFG